MKRMEIYGKNGDGKRKDKDAPRFIDKRMDHHLEKIIKTSGEDKKRVTSEMAGFKRIFSRFIQKADKEMKWSGVKSIPKNKLADYESLSKKTENEMKDLLSKLAIVKLNGGLATTMGCTGPKGLIEVKEGASFLDIIVEQVTDLNEKHGVDVPLVLMNSFNTSEETRRVLKKYESENLDIIAFEQARYPRIYSDSLMPLPEKSCSDRTSWYPPGHGDIYWALNESGVLDELISRGKEYIFVSNLDNLGALFDPSIFSYFIKEKLGFLMEVTEKTKSDIKGGTLVEYGDTIRLLELAQVKKEHKEEFYSIKKFKFFNTNNVWISLSSIKELVQRDHIDLDIIVNKKTVNDGKTNVIQLETAIGSSIKYFENAKGIAVPRTRFLPVKDCSDLLLIQSNLYSLEEGKLKMHPQRLLQKTPIIKLSSNFKKIPDFTMRFTSIPDILHLDHLTVCGDVNFGADVKLSGTVIIVAADGNRIDIPDGAFLCDKVISGNLSIAKH
eukprot:GHVP01068594.1.p1 GENE.GHVP01068594.1~~GHVP01068594.1.p1  ORF type:complete len:497 (+),score=99.49 GHVP01068594.1:35-1525(+)